RVREWLARATRAPRDAAWVADGLISDHWMPVSPISGRLDAFVWTVPPATLGSQAPALDDVLGDLDHSTPLIEAKAEAVEAEPVAVAPPSPPPPAAPPPPPVVPAPVKEAPVEVPKAASVSEPEPAPVPAPAPAVEPAPKVEALPEKTEAKAAGPAEAPAATSPADARLKPVIFPVAHAPDDPGPDEASPAQDKKGKFRLFG
ncbi:MAG: hypothetical protein Q8S58_10145, partial [Bosea sp. (in: a-proteobacteria)]|nr:hypothetical protein [Bosea sp. (in: a-proteobacteria)]